MDTIGIKQLPAQLGALPRRGLPLELGRQPSTGPSGERIGLVE
jgi:hypothetical protein